MRIAFSEAPPDYSSYLFPYAVWAYPDAPESPATLFARGFLPSSPNLDRFYLCRHVRVDLTRFQPSSENRRILRKGSKFQTQLLPRDAFHFTEARRRFCKHYADQRFGQDRMPPSRLDRLFTGAVTSHLLLAHDSETGQEVGLATLYWEPPHMAYYYYAFYDPTRLRENLGIYMMTSAVERFAREGTHYLYLGTVYYPNALYKTQFEGTEFFNGLEWCPQLEQLKYLVRRSTQGPHLLEDPEFMERFYPHGTPSQGLHSLD